LAYACAGLILGHRTSTSTLSLISATRLRIRHFAIGLMLFAPTSTLRAGNEVNIL